MVDPVVNSKFGNRPLLEVPAMVVNNGPAHMEVSSLQDRQPQMIKYPESLSSTGLQLQGQQGQAVPTLLPPGALPLGLPVSMFYAPSQSNVAPPMNAQFINVPSMNLQAPPYTVVDASGKPVPAPAQFPVSNPAFPAAPPQVYYPTGYQPSAVAPLPAPVDNFVVEGQLHYGRLTTLHFRNGNASNFRGLPEFLGMELQNTYGGFPRTEIRVVAQGGAYHIYATPRREREEYEFLFGPLDRERTMSATTYGGGTNERRMIGGFNRIVGRTAPDFQ